MTKINDLSKYFAIREHMGTFDRLEWHSSSLLGNLIRWKTKDWSNHTGAIIIFNEYGKSVFCMESLEHGPDANRLSLRLQQYKGEVRWYPLKKEHHAMRALLGTKLLDQEGIEYDTWDMAGNLIKRPEIDPKKLYCSEYIAYVGKITGLPWDKQYLGGKAPTPGIDMDGLNWWEKGVRIL
jgi:hypothetical protein